MSELEDAFAYHIRVAGLPEPEREYRFHPEREYRLDFAYPEIKLGIELQGGIWTGGAHARGTGLERDYEKINTAQLYGWVVLQFSTGMVKKGEALTIVEAAIEKLSGG